MDLDLIEWIIGIALVVCTAIGLVLGFLLEWRRDGRWRAEIEVRLAVVERRVELAELEDVYEEEKDGD